MNDDSDDNHSRYLIDASRSSSSINNSRNDSNKDSDKNRSPNSTNDDSVIITRNKGTRRAYILDSESDSESESDAHQNELSDDESNNGHEKSEEGGTGEDENSFERDESQHSKKNDVSNKEDLSEEEDESYRQINSNNEDRSRNQLDLTSHRNANHASDHSSSLGKSRYSSLDTDDESHSNASNSNDEIIPETDDDENEKSMIHPFSPRTRRSMTGRRSIMPCFDSEDDDILMDDEDCKIINSRASDKTNNTSNMSGEYRSAEESVEIESSKDAEQFEKSDEIELSTNKRNRSIIPHDSTFNNTSFRTPKPKRYSKANASSVIGNHSTPSRSTSQIEFSDKSNASKENSVQIQSDNSEQEIKILVRDDDSVVLLNSSDDENMNPMANSTVFDFKGAARPSPDVKLVQPKLAFKSEKKFVSRAYYNHCSNEVATKRTELEQSKTLLERMVHTLPDKGVGLKKRILELEREIRVKQEKLESFAIEEDHLEEVQAIANTNNNDHLKKSTQNWRDELETVQPRYTGQQGLSTFNYQKAATLQRIERLHKAMEKCPNQNELARQPDHLNVQLMPHQLHAIRWMRWRENQRPKGGLLADDMGLGKSLTVIGLVLDTKYRKDNSLAEDEDISESENEDDDDDEDDRGRKKSYANQGGTLIVCPASLINQWEREIETRVRRRKLSVLMHHGNKRIESAHSICKYDIVITTYGVINSDHKSNSALFRIRWDRIVLDEAHQIRNHSTAVSKGCCALRSTMRWGLTGTPIQNKHMDVYSMLKFLRVTPFDDLATFKKWIDPKTQAGLSRLHNILKPMLLRRTKAELQIKGELQALPSKTINVVDIQLTPDEASVYATVLAYSQGLFAKYMVQHQERNGGSKVELSADIKNRLQNLTRFGGGNEAVKTSQILVLLLRLRQICDHPGLIHQMLQDECEVDVEDGNGEYDTMDMNIVTQLVGLKINDCDDENGSPNGQKSDEQEVKVTNILHSSNKIYDFSEPSSKCKRVIEIVERILRETEDKVVVVSQWTTFLGIVADIMHRKKIHCVELTGKTPIKERNNIVVSFNNPTSPERVMMLSLVAGGVGLNLTGANHLLLLDPHWNPQLESQAFDRVYRVGQTKDVEIYKLLCEQTVEKHIQSIQELKLTLSENVLTGSRAQGGSKLSIQDMRKLFEM